MDLTETTALVASAERGIGRAVTEALAKPASRGPAALLDGVSRQMFSRTPRA